VTSLNEALLSLGESDLKEVALKLSDATKNVTQFLSVKTVLHSILMFNQPLREEQQSQNILRELAETILLVSDPRDFLRGNLAACLIAEESIRTFRRNKISNISDSMGEKADGHFFELALFDSDLRNELLQCRTLLGPLSELPIPVIKMARGIASNKERHISDVCNEVLELWNNSQFGSLPMEEAELVSSYLFKFFREKKEPDISFLKDLLNIPSDLITFPHHFGEKKTDISEVGSLFRQSIIDSLPHLEEKYKLFCENISIIKKLNPAQCVEIAYIAMNPDVSTVRLRHVFKIFDAHSFAPSILNRKNILELDEDILKTLSQIPSGKIQYADYRKCLKAQDFTNLSTILNDYLDNSSLPIEDNVIPSVAEKVDSEKDQVSILLNGITNEFMRRRFEYQRSLIQKDFDAFGNTLVSAVLLESSSTRRKYLQLLESGESMADRRDVLGIDTVALRQAEVIPIFLKQLFYNCDEEQVIQEDWKPSFSKELSGSFKRIVFISGFADNFQVIDHNLKKKVSFVSCDQVRNLQTGENDLVILLTPTISHSSGEHVEKMARANNSEVVLLDEKGIKRIKLTIEHLRDYIEM
jgi:hypothetical protein